MLYEVITRWQAVRPLSQPHGVRDRFLEGPSGEDRRLHRVSFSPRCPGGQGYHDIAVHGRMNGPDGPEQRSVRHPRYAGQFFPGQVVGGGNDAKRRVLWGKSYNFV